MNELIHIIEHNSKKAVSARELYEFLGVKTKFAMWVNRMFEFGFEENRDFIPILGKSTGGRPEQDYALTLDTAKEISMLQRNDKGKQARKYFIEVEKAALTVMKTISPEELLLRQAQMLVDQKKRIANVEERVELLEAKLNTRPGYFTVRAYARINGIDITTSTAMEIGKLAAGICRINNYEIGRCDDSRYGWVGTYPRRVLDKVFEAVIFN